MSRRSRPAAERTPTAPKGQPPGVRELLRMLIEDARLRVRQATMPKLVAPKVPTLVLALFEEHTRTRKRLKDLDHRLKAQGYYVQTYADHELVQTNSSTDKQRVAWEQAQTKRQTTIREIHQQALLDLLTLQGKDARAYLERLRTKLAEVTR